MSLKGLLEHVFERALTNIFDMFLKGLLENVFEKLCIEDGVIKLI